LAYEKWDDAQNFRYEQNAELKNSSDTEIASTIFKSIDKRLDNYNNYFE